MTVPILAFVFVTSALVLTAPLISRYIAFNVRPSPIQDANGTKYKTSFHTPSSIDGSIKLRHLLLHLFLNPALFLIMDALTIIRPKEQSLSAVVQPGLQISITRSMIASILARQSPAGLWFLDANLVIAKGATFHIDYTDTKWLKISSKIPRIYGECHRSSSCIRHRCTW